MKETQLSGRQILMVILAVVILLCGLMAYVFVVFPSNDDLVGSRHAAIVSGVITVLATIWFTKLTVDAVRDRQRGIDHGPAKVSGWFNIFFGAAVATGGITCSALTYYSAAAAGGGMWTLYYGMVAWGIVQMSIGWTKRHGQA